MNTPICLVIAPSGFLLDERVFMSLGILRVAAVLEQRGIPVELLDLSGIENYEDVVKLHAMQSRAVQFGITATTPQMPAAVKVAEAIKSVKPKGSRIYTDRPTEFAALPNELSKGDYLQLPSEDRNYSALDLIQFNAAQDLELYIAHDDRLPRPKWLTSDFRDAVKPGTTTRQGSHSFRKTKRLFRPSWKPFALTRLIPATEKSAGVWAGS